MSSESHWQEVYQSREPQEVGWYRPHLECSLELIESVAAPAARIIDVGGGCSTLVDDLLDRGFDRVTVLDIAQSAIDISRRRLGSRAAKVAWLAADVANDPLPQDEYDLWHDRAVFHFLTRPGDRAAYVAAAARALKPGGWLIVAAFSPEAPPRCSGLDVVRYTFDSLRREFRDQFVHVKDMEQLHVTPSGVKQPYIYCLFRRKPPAG